MSSWRIGRRVALLLLLAIPAGGAAQDGCATWVCAGVEVPSVRMDARLAGINAALGAFTVGVTSLIRHGHVSWKSMALGAVGGATTFAGKRIAVDPFDGSGLLGRQVAGLGSAMVYNLGHEDGPFDRVGFSFGPLRLQIAKGDGTRLVVDATSTIAAAYFALEGTGAQLDLRRSLSSGALVFREPGLDRPGRSLGSVILLREAGTYTTRSPCTTRRSMSSRRTSSSGVSPPTRIGGWPVRCCQPIGRTTSCLGSRSS